MRRQPGWDRRQENQFNPEGVLAKANKNRSRGWRGQQCRDRVEVDTNPSGLTRGSPGLRNSATEGFRRFTMALSLPTR